MAAGTVIRGVSCPLLQINIFQYAFIFSQFLPRFVCFLPTFSTFCLDVAWIYLPKPKVQLKASAPGLTVFKLGRVWSVGAVGAGHNGSQTADTGSVCCVCSVCCVRLLTGVGCFQDLNQILSSPLRLTWTGLPSPLLTRYHSCLTQITKDELCPDPDLMPQTIFFSHWFLIYLFCIFCIFPI